MESEDSPRTDEYHSLSEDDGVRDEEDGSEFGNPEPPVHPVPAMQGAFEESIIESTAEDDQPRVSLERDAEARRQMLLFSKQYDHSLNSRWNQRNNARYHPLLKLLAQIVFGMHLLQQEQAKSEGEVVKILQTHVNEVDAFLERTSEDFELAIKDIEERIKFLRLPMKHLDVFNIMLEEKKFRMSLLDGNDKIAKIIDRTTKAKNGALMDIQTGIDANQELSRYLNSIQDQWPSKKRAIAEVFGAMRGNEQGWTGYLKDLEGKGKILQDNLSRLAEVIAHMSKLAAAASRRSKTQVNGACSSSPGSRSAPNSPGLRSKFAPDPAAPPMPGSPRVRKTSLDKPLPRPPQADAGASQNGTPIAGHRASHSRDLNEQQRASQYSQTRKVSPLVANGEASRPKTSDGPTRRLQARGADERTDTNDLLEFFKAGVAGATGAAAHSNPLRSNPPESQAMLAGSPPERKASRTQSSGAIPLIDARSPGRKLPPSLTVNRSMSQGAMEMQSNTKSTPIAMPAISENEKPATYQPTEGQSTPRKSAFARRLSKRMKHMQDTPSDPQQRQTPHISIERPAYPSPSSDKTLSPPIDSAYASSVEKQAPSPSVGQTEYGEQPKTPIGGFTIFPPAATFPASPDPKLSPEDRKSVATSKGRSFGSMRKYFHLRKSSKMWG